MDEHGNSLPADNFPKIWKSIPDLPVVELFERNDAGGIEVDKVPPGVKLVVKKYFEEDEEEPSEEVLGVTWEEGDICHITQVLEDIEGKYWLHTFWAKESDEIPRLCPLCGWVIEQKGFGHHLQSEHRAIIRQGENNDKGKQKNDESTIKQCF